MDRLEEHIRKNREDLDRYYPSSGIWENVRKNLKKENTSFKRWLSIAAMVIVILGTSLIFLRPGFIWSFSGIESNGDRGNHQLKETEIYYNNLVNSLYLEATPLLTGNPEIQKELSSDIFQLDSICLDIKKDLKDNVDNQEVVEALIQNYRLKIRLLEDMLTILKENESNPIKKGNYEL